MRDWLRSISLLSPKGLPSKKTAVWYYLTSKPEHTQKKEIHKERLSKV
jgi:hypothetical protein